MEVLFIGTLLGFLMLIVPLAAFVFLLWFLLMPIIKGAPFVPSEVKTVEKMIGLAKIRHGERAVDLGSGDGRFLIALAQKGIEAHGYEINPLLVWWTRSRIKKAGMEKRAFVHWKSFWHVDCSSYDVVLIFGIFYIMRRLEKKLRNELKSGARVVSNAFTFPNWVPEKTEKGVYLYRQA